MALGFALGIVRLVLVIFKKYLDPESLLGQFVAVNWLYFCFYLFLITLATIVTMSFFTKKSTA
jgi:hypothetical protein